jgi:hypothetical protein
MNVLLIMVDVMQMLFAPILLALVLVLANLGTQEMALRAILKHPNSFALVEHRPTMHLITKELLIDLLFHLAYFD